MDSTPVRSVSSLALAVWGPVLVVLLVGLVPWGAAVTDNDALADRALRVAVLVGLVATVPSWAAVRGWPGLVGGVVVKLACGLLLAPHGLATLLGDRAPGYGDDGLRYFWGAPPLLLLVTALEGWLVGLRGRGVSLTQTRVWARRRLLLTLMVIGVVVGGGWWLGRTEYYLWRMRAHDHAPSSHALRKVGPAALPRIYRELDELGDRAAGDLRGDLVHVIAEIRSDMIARQIGSPIVWEAKATLVEPDPALVAAVGAALEREPDVEQRKKIAMWAGDLDFNSVVELFCGTFARVPFATRAAMAGSMLASSGVVEVATRTIDVAQRPAVHDPQYPWRDMPQAEIERVQALMRARLACVPPLLVEMLEERAGAWSDGSASYPATEAVDMLAKLRPLDADLGARLYALLPSVPSGYFVTDVLARFGPDLAAATRQTLQQTTAGLFIAAASEDVRQSLAFRVLRDGGAAGIDAAALFCELLPRAPEEQRGTIFMLLDSERPAGDPCVLAAIMATYEQATRPVAGGGCGELAMWETSAGFWLRKEAADPRVAAWARGLMSQVAPRCRRETLAGLVSPP